MSVSVMPTVPIAMAVATVDEPHGDHRAESNRAEPKQNLIDEHALSIYTETEGEGLGTEGRGNK